ncbi:MAG: hypothetical protein R3A52_27035 [Polyangiales bacterium]
MRQAPHGTRLAEWAWYSSVMRAWFVSALAVVVVGCVGASVALYLAMLGQTAAELAQPV